MASTTRYVLGLPEALGGSGDPSPVTAFGVFHGMRACLEEVYGTDSLVDRTIALQGLGHVGRELARLIHEAGGRLLVTDVNPLAVEQAVTEFGAIAVPPQEVYEQPCDIFAPCALGSILNAQTIPRLQCRIVAGAANNQRLEDLSGTRLWERGILYAPDYAINAGGLMNIAQELRGYDREAASASAKGIHDTIAVIITRARQEDIPTHIVARRMAEEALAAAMDRRNGSCRG
jgi:leucine dehydrogenase